jgi:RNase P subunit RPR2
MLIYNVTCKDCGNVFRYEPTNKTVVVALRSGTKNKGTSKTIIAECPHCHTKNKFEIIA